MKKTIVIVLSLIIISSISFGQTKFIPHKKGNDAMLFQLNGLATLGAGAYRGGFGYKKYIKDKTALRAALSFRNTNEKFKGYVPEGYVVQEGFDKEFQLGVEVAGEIHRNKGKIDPYYGAGAMFYLTRSNYAEPAIGPQGTPLVQNEIKNELGNATTNIGVFGLLGVEYVINKMFSLAVEYHLGFSNSSQPDMVLTDGSGLETVVEGGSYTYFGINSTTVLTLAIYLN